MLEELGAVCDVLYAASLLKEEGNVVRARVVIARPEEFPLVGGPPEGIHAVRFTTPHPFTPNEIKRMSPAADFFHSALAIWPDRDRGFMIWGILNTWPRWLNLMGGGRKPTGDDMFHPVIHVRDPGWLLFYHGYDLIAEWRGREFHGPRMDVFQSQILNDRFAGDRQRFVESLIACCLPPSLDANAYGELAHLISLQFVKRVINLVRTSGHGGSLISLPEVIDGKEAAASWIDCKYAAVPDLGGLRFRSLVESMIRRVDELCEDGSSVEDAWSVFRNSKDMELDHLEEAFFELARLFSDLMQVDGALVLDKRVGLVGFGGEIRVDQPPFPRRWSAPMALSGASRRKQITASSKRTGDGILTVEDRFAFRQPSSFASACMGFGDWYLVGKTDRSASFLIDGGGGAELRLDVEFSGPGAWEVREIENPDRQLVSRLGLSLVNPAAEGFIRTTIRPASEEPDGGAIKLPAGTMPTMLEDLRKAPERP